MSVMRTSLLSLILSLGLFPGLLAAAVIEDFFRVELPLDEGQDRDQQLRAALDVMLLRLGGPDVLKAQTSLKAALDDPRSLMRRIGSGDDERLEVDFEPALLRDLLGQARLPMLGASRPEVILWAVLPGTLGDELVLQGSEWSNLLRAAAQQRAVALTVPLADLQDRSLVTEAQIREADQDVLLPASERYASEVVLALAIDPLDEGVRLSWTLWVHDKQHTGRVSESSVELAADKLMLNLANLIFAQYAVQPLAPSAEQQTGRWVLVVDNVSDLDAFSGLQRTLQQLSGNTPPQILSIEGSQVRMGLDFPGSESQLERLLVLDQRLLRLPAPVVSQPQVEEPESEPATMDELLAEQAQTEPAAEPEPEPETEPVEPEADTAQQQTLYFRWR